MKRTAIWCIALAGACGGLGFALGSILVSDAGPCPPCQEARPAVGSGPVAPAVDAPRPPAPDQARPHPSCDCAGSDRAAEPDKIGQLEAKLAFQKTMLEGYREQIYGKPVPWPEQILPQYQEENFQANLAQAIDEVEAAVEVTAFDCKEPPCIAALRVLPGQNRKLLTSEAWAKNYGENISSNFSGTVDCGNGRTERVWLLAPAGDGQIDPREMTKEAFFEALKNRPRGPEDENRSKRLRARWEEMREAWTCLPP